MGVRGVLNRRLPDRPKSGRLQVVPAGSGTAARQVKYPGNLKSRRKFLRFFPGAFHDETYFDWERGYKWTAHERWNELLNPTEFAALLKQNAYGEVANRAVKIESRTNLLFSFEKMALRDAIKTESGARLFSQGLFELLHGKGFINVKFERWCGVVSELPRKQTRVLTWPLVTVFGFIAQPQIHIFLKPNVTRRAALEYGFPFAYQSRPSWKIYSHLLEFAAVVRRDLHDLHPEDLIDIQSFLWVQGSDEYS
jgi:hypothetical protein